MDNTEKKISAAIAAVMSYIQTDEEAICAAGMMAAPPVAAAPAPSAPMNLWAISGRQSMMQTRNLMQMRAFK